MSERTEIPFDWEAHYLPDIEYLAWWRPRGGKPDAPSVEVQAVRVVGFSLDGAPEHVERKGWRRSGDDTTLDDREGSNHFLEGILNWDGCANIDFGLAENGSRHFCGRQAAIKVGTLLDHLYQIAWEFHVSLQDYVDVSLFERGF